MTQFTFRVLMVFATLLAGGHQSAHADLPSAMAALENGRHAEAHAEFRRMAELGDRTAQRNLIALLFNGTGIEKNIVEANAWLNLMTHDDASDASLSAVAQVLARSTPETARAEISERTQTLIRQFSRATLSAERFPTLRAEEGKAVYQLTCDLRPGIHLSFPRYPADAARQGVTGSSCQAFYLDQQGKPAHIRVVSHKNGHFFNMPTRKVLQEFHAAPPADDFQRMREYRVCMDYTLAPELHSAQQLETPPAEQWLPIDDDGNSGRDRIIPPEEAYRLAGKGDATGAYRYARYAQLGNGIVQGSAAARSKMSTELLLRAAVGGHTPAQMDLADSLFHGNGCETDLQKALFWYRTAIASGDNEARYRLAARLAEGNAEQKRSARELLADYLNADNWRKLYRKLRIDKPVDARKAEQTRVELQGLKFIPEKEIERVISNMRSYERDTQSNAFRVERPAAFFDARLLYARLLMEQNTLPAIRIAQQVMSPGFAPDNVNVPDTPDWQPESAHWLWICAQIHALLGEHQQAQALQTQAVNLVTEHEGPVGLFNRSLPVALSATADESIPTIQ